MKLEITGENIRVEKKPPLRAAFEDMTRKMIADVMRYPDSTDVDPDVLFNIRENVRALGEISS